MYSTKKLIRAESIYILNHYFDMKDIGNSLLIRLKEPRIWLHRAERCDKCDLLMNIQYILDGD